MSIALIKNNIDFMRAENSSIHMIIYIQFSNYDKYILYSLENIFREFIYNNNFMIYR